MLFLLNFPESGEVTKAVRAMLKEMVVLSPSIENVALTATVAQALSIAALADNVGRLADALAVPPTPPA
jgi:hypothetical protein